MYLCVDCSGYVVPFQFVDSRPLFKESFCELHLYIFYFTEYSTPRYYLVFFFGDFNNTYIGVHLTAFCSYQLLVIFKNVWLCLLFSFMSSVSLTGLSMVSVLLCAHQNLVFTSENFLSFPFLPLLISASLHFTFSFWLIVSSLYFCISALWYPFIIVINSLTFKKVVVKYM